MRLLLVSRRTKAARPGHRPDAPPVFLLSTDYCLLFSSTRRRLAGARDAYPVVCELEVHRGQLDARHVAGHAAVGRDGARRGRARARLGLFGRRDVTGEAVGVVLQWVALQRRVRVVAGRAAHAAVVCEVAAAVEDAVGLEAHVGRAALILKPHHRVEALVARAAELLRQLHPAEPGRVVDVQVLQVLRPDRRDVPLAGAVARLAADARRGRLQLESCGARARRRVAAVTAARGLVGHRAPQSLFERGGLGARVLDGEVEAVERAEVADAALVVDAAAPEDVGLAGDALAEAEDDGLGDGRGAVGDGVDDGAALARELVCVTPLAEAHPRPRLQSLAVRGALRGAPHRRQALRRLLRVTPGASLGADVTNPRVVAP